MDSKQNQFKPSMNMNRMPELKNRIYFTIAMLAICRLGVFVPMPGISTSVLAEKLRGTVFEFMSILSGGALENFSILGLGVMPYISASIIMQLLTVSIPTLKQLQEEGESGRNKINQWTRYATVVLALVQGFGICYGVLQNGWTLPNVSPTSFLITSAVTLTAGTLFMMWIGEQISQRGIGNGISLLIFAGIASRIPSGFVSAWENRDQYFDFMGFIALLGFLFMLVATIVYFERAQRRIPIHYAKRVVGRKMYGGQTSHLPLKINMAGVIPPIFASSILMFLPTIATFVPNPTLKQIANMFTHGWLYYTLYVAAIIFFTFFYTAVTFDPQDIADNLQKNGGFVPGIRPGTPTRDYLDRILTRITMGGALYITAVCVLPQVLNTAMKIPSDLTFTFGGTSVLIIVGVAMDTVAQIEGYMLSRGYEGFLGSKGGRFKGRKG